MVGDGGRRDPADRAWTRGPCGANPGSMAETPTRNVALLIDADNASSATLDPVLTVLAELGTVNVRRVDLPAGEREYEVVAIAYP